MRKVLCQLRRGTVTLLQPGGQSSRPFFGPRTIGSCAVLAGGDIKRAGLSRGRHPRYGQLEFGSRILVAGYPSAGT
jgi:hypothetical protein